MPRGRTRRDDGLGPKRFTHVNVPLDEELAAHLDRAQIAFGLESRQQVATMAVRAWLAANMENETIHRAVQIALKQAREHEFKALADYYQARAREFAMAFDPAEIIEHVPRGAGETDSTIRQRWGGIEEP